jgi:hypothetical protein
MPNYMKKALIIGAVIGALTGLAAAYIMVQRAEMEHIQPKITAGEGVKVGLGVLGILRMMADIGKESK